MSFVPSAYSAELRIGKGGLFRLDPTLASPIGCIASRRDRIACSRVPNSVIIGRLRSVDGDSFILGGGLRIFLAPGVPIPDHPIGTSLTVVAVTIAPAELLQMLQGGSAALSARELLASFTAQHAEVPTGVRERFGAVQDGRAYCHVFFPCTTWNTIMPASAY